MAVGNEKRSAPCAKRPTHEIVKKGVDTSVEKRIFAFAIFKPSIKYSTKGEIINALCSI